MTDQFYNHPRFPTTPPFIDIDSTMRRFIDDARMLLEYAIAEAALRMADAEKDHIIQPISEIAYPENRKDVTRGEWIAFLDAYERLSTQMGPITASSLRNTNVETLKGFRSELWSPSTASSRVTRNLFIATFAFLLIVITTDIVAAFFGPPREYPEDLGQFLSMFLGFLEPFVYGGLGACAYLLRRAHAHFAARTFNANFRPEYLTRIVVGVVSGGAMTLFVVYVVDADGVVPKLSQAAIGFLAGYSTELLFRTVDRLLEALFPRANPPHKG
jgi:hypothetical protein